MMRALLIAGCLCTAQFGCNSEPEDGVQNEESSTTTTLNVAAAANLQFAFDDIEMAFETAHPDINLEMTYGSSGNFYAQLTQDAPFDIFFSADTTYPQRLVDDGLASEKDYFQYAVGQIVIWVTNDSPIDVEAAGMNAVTDPAVSAIAVANPDLAPYGAAAVEAMQHLNVYNAVEDKLVMGENISQAAQFVQSGAADVGFIALSMALSPEMSDQGKYWIVPADAYGSIVQAGVIPLASDQHEAAELLKEFIFGVDGQEILARFGYKPPEEK